jgi:hypothetical protein
MNLVDADKIYAGASEVSKVYGGSTELWPGITNTVVLMHFNKRLWQAINAVFDDAEKKFGATSMYFDGSGDRVKLPFDHADFDFASGAFCIDWQMKLPSAPGAWLIATKMSAGYNGFQLYTGAGGNLSICCYNGDGGTSTHWWPSWDTNWHHFALTSDGTKFRLFMDGAQVSTDKDKVTMGNSTGPFLIGIDWDESSGSLNGWIDEFRISNVVRWTSNFTAPTAPWESDANTLALLHFNGADGQSYPVIDDMTGGTFGGAIQFFLDESGKQWYVGEGTPTLTSVSPKLGVACLSVSGARIETVDHAHFDFGTDNFTIEAWVCPAEIAAVHGCIFTIRGGNTDFIVLSLSGAGEDPGKGHWVFDVKASDSYIVSVPAVSRSITLNQWYHVAIVRNGDIFTIYEDGVAISSDTDAGHVTMPDLSVNPCIGGKYDTGWSFSGKIDEFRICKSARYTGEFVPPATEFTMS